MPRLTCPKCGRTYWDDERHICLLNSPAQRALTVPTWAAVIPAVLLLAAFTFAAARNWNTRTPASHKMTSPIVHGVQQRKAADVEDRLPDTSTVSGTPAPSQHPGFSVPSPPPPGPPIGGLESSTVEHPPGGSSSHLPTPSGGEPLPAGATPAPGVSPNQPPPVVVPRQRAYQELYRIPTPSATQGERESNKQPAVSAPVSLPAPQPAPRTLYSTFFPLHLGESRIYFAQGHLQRMLLLYANLNNRPALQAQLVLDLPQDFKVEKVAMVEHPNGGVRTHFTTESVRHSDSSYVRHTIPMFTIPANFKGAGPDGIWDRWQGWWSYLYVTPQAKPGTYRIYWSLQSSDAREPEQSAETEVLPPVPAAQVGENARVGAWLYRLLDYQEDPQFERRLVAELRHIGVGKIALSLAAPQTRPDANAGLARANQRAASYARRQGITTFGVNWWASWSAAPRTPPAEAMAMTADGRRLNVWCPGYVVERGPAFRTALRDVTEAVKRMGVDGFTLDYRTAFASDDAHKGLCYDARCRRQFQTYAKIRSLNFPKAALPGGKYRRQWLNFRAYQRAESAKALGEAVWKANKKAVVETWTSAVDTAASESPYGLISYSASQLAPRVNRVMVSALLLPPMGESADVMSLVKDTVEHAKPASVTVGIMTAPVLNAARAPRPDPNLLNYQVLSHIADGAAGIDLWGLGALDDGRCAHFISRWSTLLALAEPYVSNGRKIESAALKVQNTGETPAVRLVAYQRPGEQLVALLNSTPQEQTVRLFPTQTNQTQAVWDLMTGRRLGSVASGNTLPIIVPPLDARFLTTRTGGGWQVAVRRFFGAE